jgi:hypothetical protein
MAKIDVYGKLAAAEIAFYVPLAIATFFLTLRYGFRRDAGWIFMLVFSVVRVTAGAVYLAAELVRPMNSGLYTAANILQSVGIAPLLLATLGFIGLVGQQSFSQFKRVRFALKVTSFVILGGVALSVAGGVISSSDQPSNRRSALNMRRVGIIVIAVGYLLVVYDEAVAWSHRLSITRHREHLLRAVTLALPFLAVRVVYGILNVWSTITPSLAKYNSVSGTWWIYLVMSLLTEYITAIIYVTAGTLIPLSKDDTY